MSEIIQSKIVEPPKTMLRYLAIHQPEAGGEWYTASGSIRETSAEADKDLSAEWPASSAQRIIVELQLPFKP